MPFVVLKFGGSSVSTVERWQTIASEVRARREEGLRPVLVCSALSGVSNTLEELLNEARHGRHDVVLARIEDQHRELAETMGLQVELLAGEFEELRRLATGTALLGEVGARVRARTLALGELMSTRLGAAWLRKEGIPVTWLDARTVLTSAEEASAPEQRRFLAAGCVHEPDPALQERLGQHEVVLTQGFIASDPSGATVLLGRGGSDTSAACFAAKLDAVRCEIWTDVPGMFTANPRLVPSARLLRELDYDEAQECATTGAGVLHPRAIGPCRRAGIPLHIRSTAHPDLEGTRISADARHGDAQVKAISARSGLVLIAMETLGMWQQVGFLADVFAVFKRHGVSVDTVSTSETNVTVTLDPRANALAQETLAAVMKDLAGYCQPRLVQGCASVSLVGRGIRTILHRLAPVLEVFEEQRIHLVSQAASDLNLTFVVDDEQAERLVRKLHTLLFAHRGGEGALGRTWQELFAPRRAPERAVRVEWWVKRRPELLLLAESGRTPLYVYDGGEVQAAARRLLGLRSVDRVLYAMKANSHPDLLRFLGDAGVGFECVSPGEVARVLQVFPDLNPSEILFTPNFAPREEYEAAFARGVRVTLDNLHPLEAWPEVFAGREVFVRLDPGRGRGHHAKVRTAGARSKFGIAPDQIQRLATQLAAVECRVVGLHAHTGSGVLNPTSWQDTALFLADAATAFPDATVLDLGGGLGVPERRGGEPLDLDALDEAIGQFRAVHPRFQVWLEPGRYLVAEAGVLLARVTQLKRKSDQHYVGVDAGMHTLLRPALYGAWHPIVNLSRLGQPHALVANVVGPICETGDVLGHGRRLPETHEGDILLIANAGAYGRAMSSTYNLRDLPGEVVLNPQVLLAG